MASRYPDDASRDSRLSRRDFVSAWAAVVAAPLLSSCGEKPSPTQPDTDPRLTARPGVPQMTPTTGATQLGLGSPRDGLLYVPEGYTPDVSWPLFVALHGAGGSSDDWSSYLDRAEERGMIVLAPDSRLLTWDIRFQGFGPDVIFLDNALAHTFERCRVDSSRIALAGFSDGASYALSLGLSNGDLFSHLIGFSPGFLAPAEPIVGRPPIFISHGTQDNILPVTASRDVIVPALRDDGYDVTYTEFDGGHTVPADVSESALDWFLGSE